MLGSWSTWQRMPNSFETSRKQQLKRSEKNFGFSSGQLGIATSEVGRKSSIWRECRSVENVESGYPPESGFIRFGDRPHNRLGCVLTHDWREGPSILGGCLRAVTAAFRGSGGITC